MKHAPFLSEMGIIPAWVTREHISIQKNVVKTDVLAPPLSSDTTAQASSSVLMAKEKIPLGASIGSLDLPGLLTKVATCTACALCQERKQVVFGVGDPHARWLFIGEGPGAEEDETGEPFVGQAGKLLEAMLFSMNLKRGQGVYIANALKCRPPANRTPSPQEIATCLPYLKAQIALIGPSLIVLLGKTAAKAVLGLDETLGRLRGKRYTYHDGSQSIPTLVTYHPAYLLRNLPDKARAWEDLCEAMAWMKEISPKPW